MEEADRFVRDLIWAINSPLLLSSSPSLELPDEASLALRHLKSSDVDRDHLKNYLTSHRERRVGRYFERLVLYWLKYIRGCEIAAHSPQLREGKRTVGEIDLLFVDEHKRLTHWELAVKFYLQVGMGDSPTPDYIGPNVKDTLRRKITRLVEHQLPLSLRYFPDVKSRQAFVKGRIFYHWRHAQNGIPSPQSATNPLATNHLRGRWMRAGEVPAFLDEHRMRYRILQKPFWLADETADPSDEDVLWPDEIDSQLRMHFSSNRSPVLISGLDAQKSPRHESGRFFVVDDHWPLPHQALR